MRTLFLLMVAIGLMEWTAGSGYGQGPRPPERPPGPPRNATERQRQPGPWDNDVVVWRVTSDGRSERLATFERAGVPTVARLKDGRLAALHQHFPANDEENFDKVAARFSSDEGKTWTAPAVIELSGLPEGMRFPFDPTLVPLPDGKARLYFTSVALRREPNNVPAIYSALSDDCVHFKFEAGARFGISDRMVIDCAVVLHQGMFHLYAPDNGPGGPRPPAAGQPPSPADRLKPGVGYHAISQDGLSFTRQADVVMSGARRWLGNAQSDGKIITFFGTGDPGGPNGGGGGVWIGTSSDGEKWELAEQRGRIMGADPGGVTLKDGSLLIVATGGPRPGTASANRRGNPELNPPRDPPLQHHPLFRALDLDGDGEISAREMEAAAASLRKADRNGDGKLTREDWR